MIQINNLSKTYQRGKTRIKALDSINLTIHSGSFNIVSGPSGCGKTTLLMCIGGLLRPTAGSVILNNTDIYKLSSSQRRRFCSMTTGFVFQSFHLIPFLTIIENIELAGSRMPTDKRRQKTIKLIEKFVLSCRKDNLASELSAGEKQRTAISRAMLNEPDIILADEPTGNLDPENAEIVISYLREFNKKGGTVILATHSTGFGLSCDNVIKLN
jgi:putative ABC transport system ATP-binding protein